MHVCAGILGGSIAWGDNASKRGQDDFASLVHLWVRRAFPGADHTLVNAALPAVPSYYMALCLAWHLPEDVDLVVVEVGLGGGVTRGGWVAFGGSGVVFCVGLLPAVQHCEMVTWRTSIRPVQCQDNMTSGFVLACCLQYNINDGDVADYHPYRRGYERLTRRLLDLPSRPAVLHLFMHQLMTPEQAMDK